MTAWWSLLQADATRTEGRGGVLPVVRALLLRRTGRPVLTLRLAQAAAARPVWRWALLLLLPLHAATRWWSAMDLPWRTRVGYGFRIDHGWGLVVNADAVIGNNVTLFHGVTLGQRDRIDAAGRRVTDYPVIEDEVWIGPNATIAGVRVGRGSRIAAGALVMHDVPPYSLVIGNPGQVVRSDVPADVMHPAAAPAATPDDAPDTRSPHAKAS